MPNYGTTSTEDMGAERVKAMLKKKMSKKVMTQKAKMLMKYK